MLLNEEHREGNVLSQTNGNWELCRGWGMTIQQREEPVPDSQRLHHDSQAKAPVSVNRIFLIIWAPNHMLFSSTVLCFSVIISITLIWVVLSPQRGVGGGDGARDRKPVTCWVRRGGGGRGGMWAKYWHVGDVAFLWYPICDNEAAAKQRSGLFVISPLLQGRAVLWKLLCVKAMVMVSDCPLTWFLSPDLFTRRPNILASSWPLRPHRLQV